MLLPQPIAEIVRCLVTPFPVIPDEMLPEFSERFWAVYARQDARNMLGEITGEKAGIFKKGVPAYTAPQPEEATIALKQRASELGISLQVADPLEPHHIKDQHLELQGEHQYINAGLAVALACTWLERQGHKDRIPLNRTDPLPDHFIRGLSSASLQGRAQIVLDSQVNSEDKDKYSSLIFYLDGAHSPESMEILPSGFPKSQKMIDDYHLLLTSL